VFIIRLKIMPWDYDRLPVDVINWLLPVSMALGAIDQSRQDAAMRKARGDKGYDAR
jgi:hypothetical protein